MRTRRYIALIVFTLIPVLCVSQSAHSWGIWHLRHLSGEIGLESQYRQLESSFNEVYEDQRSTYFLGGIKLNTSSYLWDKDVLLIDLDGVYSPESRDESYINIPDRSEVRTLKKIDLRATLCNNRPLTLQGFFNFDQNYYNRELLTNVKSNNLQWGGILSLNNKFLPISITYRNQSWDQEETETGRVFNMDQENIQARASKSFGKNDRHELIYSRNDYLYSYADLHQTQHLINRVALNDNLYFDSQRRYNLNSRITWYDQEGTTSFRRFEIMEGLTFRLPYNLRLMTNFNLYNLKDPVQTWDQKGVRTSLQHKLFKSLTSKIFFEYNRVKSESALLHKETDYRTGLDLRYTKKIPFGHLNLSYRYFRHQHVTEGETGSVYVLNEEQVMSDGEITMLNKPYVDISTVVVKDMTGSIIYQLNFDYILVERSSYVEVQRVPGGQIPNHGTVYVDYMYLQPGNYSYAANNNQFAVSILLFQKFLELYYRYSVQDYPKVEQGDLLTLNYYNQHVYGVRLDVGFARGGIESDAYSSNIIPYKMWRYYLDMNWNYNSKLLLTLSGSIRDYQMIADEVDQMYANVSGKVAYRIRPQMLVSLETGYLNQSGTNLDLDLLTGRAEFHSVFNKLHLRIGIEMYRRMYLNSEFAFNGAYVRVTRKF